MADNRPQIPGDADYTNDRYRAPDPVLQDMATLAIDEGQRLFVTLVVSGGLIGGLVEGGREFFKSISQHLRDGENLAEPFDPTASSLPDSVRRAREGFVPGDSTAPSSRLLRYLHLQDAVYAAPGQLAVSLGHTRVQLSQVSAWSVGHLDIDATLR